jgi:hypothetical protein
MTADAQTAREDLAFLRNLLDAGAGYAPAFAEGYLAAGLVYGAQMLIQAAQFLGWLPGTWPVAALSAALGPTVLFIPLITWINWRHRRDRPPAGVGRAIGAAFSAVGLANLALVAVIGSVAWREHSLTTWLIYPCAVFVLQGAAWFVAALMRRRAWLAAVAAGWWIAAIAMAASVDAIALYVLFAGAGIWLCMALPGWVMTRLARRAPSAIVTAAT